MSDPRIVGSRLQVHNGYGFDSRVKRKVTDVTTSKRACDRPICLLAHELVNKVSVIVGRCDLLGDLVATDAGSAKHLKVIRDMAMSMAESLNEHQRQLASPTPPEAMPKGPQSERRFPRVERSEELPKCDDSRQVH